MDLGLDGKVAIVTGSARGLGVATARRLAQEGARVVITDINAELAQATAERLRNEGLAAHCIVGDITKAADVQRLVDETVAHFGGVHVLVNNAGAPRDKYLVKMTEEDWDFVITVMLKGAFWRPRPSCPASSNRAGGGSSTSARAPTWAIRRRRTTRPPRQA